MFHVLIADDECSVAESLQSSIDWKGLGLTVEACVSNGRQAMEIAGRTKIDIAILDIRMPGMSGLELCEYLRRQQENIQLIIISGYAEFSYAERAIRYGVLGYCLKPLEYENLTKLLLKAVQNLERSAGSVTLASLLDALESNEENEVADILQKLGYSDKSYYAAVTIGEGRLVLSAGEGMTVEFGRGQYGYILTGPVKEETVQRFMAERGNLGIGCMKDAVAVGGLAAAFDSCTVQAYQFFVRESQAPWQTGQGHNDRRANELLGMVLQNVEKNRWETVCEQLTLIDEKYRACFDVRACLKLCNGIYTGSIFRDEENDYYVYSIKQMVSEYGSFSEMLGRLKSEIISAKAAGNETAAYSNTAFMKLMNYIGQNYKKDISLKSAGEALHMNPSYVSQLFKKEAGTTFVHYITQLRMEDAVTLLSTTKMSVLDIAMEVGFNDYFYFLKTFKKFTGKTPSRYREEN